MRKIIELNDTEVELLISAAMHSRAQQRSLRLTVNDSTETVSWKVGEGPWTPGHGYADPWAGEQG